MDANMNQADRAVHGQYPGLGREDTAILRAYARRVREAADDPRNEILRGMWREHTSLAGERPLIFVSPEGSWSEILPDSALRCTDERARRLETDLRRRLIRAELIRDDVPIEREIVIPRVYLPMSECWGVQPRRVPSSVTRGAWRYEPIIDEPGDWKQLRRPELSLDFSQAESYYAAAQEAVGDLMDVRMTGCNNFGFHLMHVYCDFRGMTNMMVDLVDEPDMVHEVIAFLADGMQHLIDQLRAHNLIALNNDQEYHYTGGLGYTNDLPAPGYDPARVRTQDVWGAAEAQEFAQVSPDMHEEFILQYERRLLENFGLNGYGCCDDLTHKLDNVLRIRNLRRVGISPWADVAQCADRLGRDYIMTWKPQPSYLAEETYKAEFVEDYLTRELERGAHARMEIILRDTHTCRGEAARFTQFVTSARRAIGKVHGPSERLWIWDNPS